MQSPVGVYNKANNLGLLAYTHDFRTATPLSNGNMNELFSEKIIFGTKTHKKWFKTKTEYETGFSPYSLYHIK